MIGVKKFVDYNAELKKELLLVTDERDRLKNRVVLLTTELESKAKFNESFTQEYDKFIAENERVLLLFHEQHETSRSIDSIEKSIIQENSNLRRALESALNEIANLNTNIHNLKIQLENVSNESSTLRVQYTEVYASLETCKQHLAESLRKNETLINQSAKMAKEYETHYAALEAFMQENRPKSASPVEENPCSSVASIVAVLKNDLEQKDGIISRYQNLVKTLSAKNANLNKEKASVELQRKTWKHKYKKSKKRTQSQNKRAKNHTVLDVLPELKRLQKIILDTKEKLVCTGDVVISDEETMTSSSSSPANVVTSSTTNGGDGPISAAKPGGATIDQNGQVFVKPDSTNREERAASHVSTDSASSPDDDVIARLANSKICIKRESVATEECQNSPQTRKPIKFNILKKL